MQEQGYSDFTALPPHEQSNIMRRAQQLKAREHYEKQAMEAANENR